MSEAEALQVVTSALNFGVLGIVFWLFVGGKLHSSAEIERLEDEKARIVAEKAKSDEQRDAAMEIANREIVPLLSSFTAATSSLLPVLQDLVRARDEGRRYRDSERGQGDRY